MSTNIYLCNNSTQSVQYILNDTAITPKAEGYCILADAGAFPAQVQVTINTKDTSYACDIIIHRNGSISGGQSSNGKTTCGGCEVLPPMGQHFGQNGVTIAFCNS
jgi:hypothetical protein